MHVLSGSLLFVEQNAYNARRAGISSAIALSVLIPFSICGFCLIIRLRERAASQRGDYYEETTNRSQFQATAATQKAAFDDDSKVKEKCAAAVEDRPGTPKRHRKASGHEGVYYTNEPLDMYTRN